MLYTSSFNPLRYVNWFSIFVSTETNLYLNIFEEEKRMYKGQKILERALFNNTTISTAAILIYSVLTVCQALHLAHVS